MRVDGYCTLGVDREYTLTEESLLGAMDAAGIERAVIAPVDRCVATDNRAGNDAMLRAAAAHRDRFIASCTANPWYGERAVVELQSAVEAGARMLVLNPAVQGFAPDDDLAWPLYESAGDLRVPVYVHTGGYQYGTPAQLALAAKRFPETVFIMGHCGSTDFKSDAQEILARGGNLYGEVSLVRPFGVVPLLAAVGEEHLLMGSAAPLGDLVFEWRAMLEVIVPERHAGFYGRTILRLLQREDAQ